jgi:hypothetical protein
MALPAGCTTSITPPPSPRDPIVVFLLDHGRHPSLVLPTPDAHLVRYVYGDWSWYALADTGALQAIRATFLGSPAALGRREFKTTDVNAILALDPAEHVYRITVSRSDAQTLLENLDSAFQSNIATLHTNVEYHLDFVRQPPVYSGLHNCNHVMAGWLRQLNCEVHGLAFLSQWDLNPPPP